MSEKNVYLLGDIHGQWKKAQEVINRKPADSMVIQLGDFGYDPHQKFSDSCGNWDVGDTDRELLPDWNLKHPLFWIDGNHEDHDSLPRVMSETSPGAVYIPRGTVLDLGVPTLCVGGADTPSFDRARRTIGRTLFPEKEGLKDSDAYRILSQIEEKPKVVLSHSAPMSFALPWIEPDIGYEDTRLALDIILRELQPEFWFFGHYHFQAVGVTRRGCRWRALGIMETVNMTKELDRMREKW